MPFRRPSCPSSASTVIVAIGRGRRILVRPTFTAVADCAFAARHVEPVRLRCAPALSVQTRSPSSTVRSPAATDLPAEID